jgi:CRP-like cAMP-binding protein
MEQYGINKFLAGASIYNENDTGSSFYLVKSGTVRTFQRESSLHNHGEKDFREGDVIGLVSAITGENALRALWRRRRLN